MIKHQRKVLISAAITGAIHTPSMSPHLPSTPQEIIDAAINAHKAGAAIVHIHARDNEGRPTTDLETYEQILSGIKKKSDVVIGITTGGAAGMTVQERLAVIPRFKPEMASANGGTMNFCFSHLASGQVFEREWEQPFVERTYDSVFKNTFADIEYCIKIMADNKTLPEYEVFDYGQLSNIAYFINRGCSPQPIYIQFVPGVMGGMPFDYDGLTFMVNQAKKIVGNDIQYCCVAPGRRMFRASAMMAILGGNVRVGMEDGLYINPAADLADSNAAQVVKIRRILEELDFMIGTPEDAREQLRLKGKDNVDF